MSRERTRAAVVLAAALAACGDDPARGAADASARPDDGDAWTPDANSEQDRSILGVQPDAVSSRGGATVEIRGTGFRPGVTVLVADTPLPVTAASTTSITCTTPVLPVGQHDVTVRWSDGTERVLSGGIEVVGAPPGFVVLPTWATPVLASPVLSMAAVDIAGDGPLELLLGSELGIAAVQIEAGPALSLVAPPMPTDEGEGSGDAAPQWPTSVVALLGHPGPVNDLLVVDVDLPQLLVCGGGEAAGALLQPIAGVWTAVEGFDAGPGVCVRATAADLDGDERNELVMVVRDGDSDRLRVLRHNGASWSPAAELEPAPEDGSGDAAAIEVTWPASESRLHVADLDGDGLPDVLTSQRGALVLYQNRGGIEAGKDEFVFRFEARRLLDRGFGALRSLDLDNDGDLDVLAVGVGLDAMLRNDGNARFFDDARAVFPAERGAGADLALTDVDGDGRVDLLVANDGQSDRFWRNVGGRFVDETPAFGFDTADSRRVLPIDVNGDGIVDVVTAGSALTVRIQNAPELP